MLVRIHPFLSKKQQKSISTIHPAIDDMKLDSEEIKPVALAII